ncbi:MAG TPA: hypothetical protein VF260_10695 [Bacilli bacterium]
MTRKWWKIVQVAFTYIGTIVGAGFATGQEILQFFTRYGWLATFTIALASLLFVWIGTKLMLMAGEINAQSYEDLNRHLFGKTAGMLISMLTLLMLFGITTVMLAGAGSVFREHLHLSYQLGLIFTLLISYMVIAKGINGILAVNTLVVPMMLIFTVLVVQVTLRSSAAGNFLILQSDFSAKQILFSPFLYTAFNLALAQAVLVPIGTAIRDRDILKKGGIFGGIGIGVMLMASHFAMSAQMPEIARFEIPMGDIIHHLGSAVRFVYIIIIYAEIFTTFIANIYGLTLQICSRSQARPRPVIVGLLIIAYLISQVGFKELLSTLYPLFGWVSLIWLVMVMWRKRAGGAGNL